MANAIVQEVLDFVRPVRLQLDRTSLPKRCKARSRWPTAKGNAAKSRSTCRCRDSLPSIQGDQYQLTQVFANLVINAYEALQGRGAVTLRARLVTTSDEGALLLDGHTAVPTVVVEVGDTGPGVTSEVADKMFNPFFTTKPQGSGLGLAIVRKIVDAHEGRIDCLQRSGSRHDLSVSRCRLRLPMRGSDSKVMR